MIVAKASSTAPFFVSFGAESYFLDQDYERARKWEGRQVLTLEGDGLTDGELVDVCETRSVDDTPRTIVVDEANKVKGDKILREYIAGKDPKDGSTVLVAILRSEKCSEVWAQAAKKGKLYEHKKLKTWDTNNEVVKWLEAEARRMNLVLDTGVSDALYTLLGHDLYRIRGELRKLVLLIGTEKATMQHLKLIIAPAPSATPFQVADAAANKNARQALNFLSTVYKNMGEEAHVPLTSALMWQVEKLTTVRSLLDRGMPEDEVATAIGMHPFRFKSALLPQVRKHSMKDLVRIMGRLCRLDADVKGSARSKRTLVELAVLSVTA